MRLLYVLLAMLCVGAVARSDDDAATKFYLVDGKVVALEKKVSDIERRLSVLEGKTVADAPAVAKANPNHNCECCGLCGCTLASGQKPQGRVYVCPSQLVSPVVPQPVATVRYRTECVGGVCRLVPVPENESGVIVGATVAAAAAACPCVAAGGSCPCAAMAGYVPARGKPIRNFLHRLFHHGQ